MRDVLLVAMGGAVGSGLRHWLAQVISRHASPELGIALVNVAGSLVLGVLVGWLSRHGPSPQLQLLMGVGLLGGFTTFSTWVVQSAELFGSGRALAGTVNLFGSLLIGFVIAGAGVALGRSFG